jgi:ribonuclease E
MSGVEAVSEAAVEEAPVYADAGDGAAQAVADLPAQSTEPPAQPSVVAVAEPQPVRATEPPVKPVAAPEPFVLPTQALQAVAAAAGLEWINSDADKIRTVQEAMAREPKPVHVPREPKPVEMLDEGPLVLVETRKDLTQFKLPFETQQPNA